VKNKGLTPPARLHDGDANMRGITFAVWLESVGPVERWLAVIGGGVVGGLLIGFLTGVFVRLVSTRKMPRWARNAVRLTGAILCGWLVALILFGGNGLGLGGTGGWGFGSGTGKSESTAKAPEGGGPGSPTSKASPVVPPAENTLRVEVLGPAPLRQLTGKADAENRYRVEGENGPKLLTLKEVKEYILQRQKQGPPLRRVVLVVYKDSPAPDKEFVTELAAWARDLPADGAKVKVDVDLPGEDAPIR
jgi:hypothetical protein